MNDELTNLLPPDREKTLHRHYLARLGVVGILLVMSLVGVAAVLLLPTYAFLSQTEVEKRTVHTSALSDASSVNEKELSARLSTLITNAKILATLNETPRVSTILSAILTVSRPGVALSGFEYSPTTTAKNSTKKIAATFAVSGTAATRDTLRNYQIALQKVSIVSSAVLPVSAYAQSSDIPFTIVLTLVL